MAIKRSSMRNAVVLVALSAALLAGCANRDSIQVGSIPDDYRTNHPIVVGERERTIDLPVAASAHKVSREQAQVLAGFMDDYDAKSGAAVRILVPYGSANAAAASAVAAQMVDVIVRQGVPLSRILVNAYDAGAPDVSAPIRVAYSAVTASVGKCGRWPKDIAETSDNRHYANFGCAYQNNLAAQVANPYDLLGPRKMTEIDPENRASAIDAYKNREISGDFAGQSEIEY
ncbi:MAG TPA: CpaD family pilus assembly lipoprotein [Rhizobiaceae bacterium]|nr:CpaD family pilus assembly lipoprotein [Rhizobiaceae bacterium]